MHMNQTFTSFLEKAREYDQQDNLKDFRKEFCVPRRKDVSGKAPVTDKASDLDEECTYLCGNSLGLMPKRSRQRVLEELEVWAERGVEGHWRHTYNRPWVTIDETVKEYLAKIVGASASEVTATSTLTSNIHAMLTTFYRPTKERFKILIEENAFPSDRYAVATHLHTRGIDPKDGMVIVKPREGERALLTEDIIQAIQDNQDIALVMLSGVQFYTGQFFEMDKITKAGHDNGCMVGWDLAHAVGNVKLQLHEWDVDFACWCSYKYLNSGAGGMAGLFVNERYAEAKDLPRLAGWWSNEKENRFEMRTEFAPSRGASGYQISNPSVLAMASLLGSLEVIDEADFDCLLKKSAKLTDFLETMLLTCLKDHHEQGRFRILTPKKRGCQLSLDFPLHMVDIFEKLQARGVICDERRPSVIRIAPTPLYNTFGDVYRAVCCLKEALDEIFLRSLEHHQ